MQGLWNRLCGTVQIDARALGAFRIVLGLLLVVKFWGTVPRNFEQVYSPTTGILGNCFAENYQQAYPHSTLLFDVRSDGAIWAFCGVAGLVMLLFMLGLYPRLMALLGSILLWLFNDRYQMVWFGWEQYAQVLLFVSIFLPSGDRLGLFPPRNAPSGNALGGPLVFVMLFQIAFIYFFNGISKNGDHWMDGSAVQFALGSAEGQLSAGAWLMQQDGLGKLLTYGTLAWEILFPVLLFMPSAHKVFRLLAALSVPAFHWGLSLFMDVGDFKFVALAVCLLLLPAFVWDKLWPKLQRVRVRAFPLPSLAARVPKWVVSVAAGVLVWVIVGSNLKQSFQSRTDDRMKAWLGGGMVEEFVGTMQPDGLPGRTFFTQHWHFFSPNPPSERGYLRVEITHLDGRHVAVFAGEEGMDELPTKTLRFLFQYLTYDRKDAKSEILASCLASREARMWHDAHPGQQAKNLTLALYTWRPATLAELKQGPKGQSQRVELIRLGFDY